jgi:hypothetical protein
MCEQCEYERLVASALVKRRYQLDRDRDRKRRAYWENPEIRERQKERARDRYWIMKDF